MKIQDFRFALTVHGFVEANIGERGRRFEVEYILPPYNDETARTLIRADISFAHSDEAFTWLIQQVLRFCVTWNNPLTSIDNPFNTPFISAQDQVTIAGIEGYVGPILVNGV